MVPCHLSEIFIHHLPPTNLVSILLVDSSNSSFLLMIGRRGTTNKSSEPGCSRDQKQPCPDDDGPDGSSDALTSRCETFDGDGRRHDSHRAKVHDPDDQEDRHQTGTALAAMEAEAQTVSPGRARVGRQRTAAHGRLPAAGKVT